MRKKPYIGSDETTRRRTMRFGKNILIPFLLTASCLLFVFGNLPSQESAAEQFEKALYYEDVQGDLQKAIGLYEQVLKQFPENSAVAGKAQLHIGLCYERLGKTEAIKAYELVLEKYAGQKELVAVARSRLAALKTEGPKELTVIKTEFHMHEPFEISPDGTKIVGVQIDKGQNIAVNHLGREGLEYITNFDWGDEAYWTYNPVWSPDGKEIVYLACYGGREEKKDYNLRASRLDGEQRILIKSETDWFIPMAWMPDGTSILAVKGDADNNEELGLVPSKGGDFTKLISLKGKVQVYGRSSPTACVSPDGRFIVFTDILPGEESDLFITTPEGKTPWPLAPNTAVDKMPRWSPDGKHIIFLSNRHGNWGLWGVAVDGGIPGDPFLIREGMGNDIFGNWTVHGLVSWNWIRIRDIYLLDVDPLTGEPKGKPRQLDYMPAGSNALPAFAPKGNGLAFIRRDFAADKGYLVVTQGDKDGAKEFEMPIGFNPMMIRWMPDRGGIGIYGNTRKGNVLLNLSFDTETWETIPLPNVRGWRPMNFAGDRKTILCCKGGLIEDGAGIIERNLETGEERLVYRPKGEQKVNFMLLESSNDYKKIAFVESNTRPPQESNTRLMVVDLETGESHVIKSTNLLFLSWSPDGQRLMSAGSWEGSEKERQSLLVFSVSDGSLKAYDLSKIVQGNDRMFGPDWSADGTQVAFGRRHNRGEHLIYKNIIPKNK